MCANANLCFLFQRKTTWTQTPLAGTISLLPPWSRVRRYRLSPAGSRRGTPSFGKKISFKWMLKWRLITWEDVWKFGKFCVFCVFSACFFFFLKQSNLRQLDPHVHCNDGNVTINSSFEIKNFFSATTNSDCETPIKFLSRTWDCLRFFLGSSWNMFFLPGFFHILWLTVTSD